MRHFISHSLTLPGPRLRAFGAHWFQLQVEFHWRWKIFWEQNSKAKLFPWLALHLQCFERYSIFFGNRLCRIRNHQAHCFRQGRLCFALLNHQISIQDFERQLCQRLKSLTQNRKQNNHRNSKTDSDDDKQRTSLTVKQFFQQLCSVELAGL